jgi:thioredoxin-like negative regulator of GroEL
MESVLAQLAADMEGKVIVGIIQESERELFTAFGVTNIPATFILYNSEVKQSYLGFQSKEVLAGSLKECGNYSKVLQETNTTDQDMR